ncbi:MAG: DUF2975 domain-containing protein [Cognatishimia sp.]
MSSYNQSNIRRLAKFLFYVTTLALLALPVLLIVACTQTEMLTEWLREAYSDYRLPDVISSTKFASILAIEAIGVFLTLFVLWQMRALFALYMSGETLTERCAKRILRIGQGLVAVGCASFFSKTIVVLILTFHNPPGQRTLSISFGDGDLGFLLAGALIVVIGWVSKEAARAAEENKAFV